MASSYPTSLDTTTTLPTESASTPLSTNHVVSHTNLADAIINIETKLGITSSAVTTTHTYKLSGVTGTDLAVSKTGTETLTNKTLTTPTITTPTFTLGSDATGDIWYRHSDGTMRRLAIGSNTQVLTVASNLPSWATPVTLQYNNEDIAVGAGNKIVTQTGFQIGAEKYAVDAAGSDTYVITLNPAPIAYVSGMLLSFKAGTVNTGAATLNVNSLGAKSILRPDGSALANGDIAANQIVSVVYDGTNLLMLSPVANSPKYANGPDSYSLTTASGTQNIAHGLGRIPRRIRLTCTTINTGFANLYTATYNGTTVTTLGFFFANGAWRSSSGTTLVVNGVSENETQFQTATITFDATNIILTWVKTNTPTGTLNIVWEAEA